MPETKGSATELLQEMAKGLMKRTAEIRANLNEFTVPSINKIRSSKGKGYDNKDGRNFQVRLDGLLKSLETQDQVAIRLASEASSSSLKNWNDSFNNAKSEIARIADDADNFISEVQKYMLYNMKVDF